MATKKAPVLSVSRGEKLPTSRGAGLTAKGREKINRATGSNLKADRKSTRLNSSHVALSRMPSSA